MLKISYEKHMTAAILVINIRALVAKRQACFGVPSHVVLFPCCRFAWLILCTTFHICRSEYPSGSAETPPCCVERFSVVDCRIRHGDELTRLSDFLMRRILSNLELNVCFLFCFHCCWSQGHRDSPLWFIRPLKLSCVYELFLTKNGVESSMLSNFQSERCD